MHSNNSSAFSVFDQCVELALKGLKCMTPSFIYYCKYFLLSCAEIDDLNTKIPISKFQWLNMRKTCEKREKRFIYWYYSTLEIFLLICKVHILFLLVYVRFLTNIYDEYIIFRFSIPSIIKSIYAGENQKIVRNMES